MPSVAMGPATEGWHLACVREPNEERQVHLQSSDCKWTCFSTIFSKASQRANLWAKERLALMLQLAVRGWQRGRSALTLAAPRLMTVPGNHSSHVSVPQPDVICRRHCERPGT